MRTPVSSCPCAEPPRPAATGFRHRHPDGRSGGRPVPIRARHPGIHLHLHLTRAVQREDRTERGGHMRRRRVGGGTEEPVRRDGELVLDPAQLLVQFAEPAVQSGQALIDEVGEFRPATRSTGVRRCGSSRLLVGGTGCRALISSIRADCRSRRPRAAAQSSRSRSTSRRKVSERSVSWGSACTSTRASVNTHPGSTDDAGPQPVRVQRPGQPRHPHLSARRYRAPGPAAAERALRVHHHRIECRRPPRRNCPSRHVLPPSRIRAEGSL
ncbi:hypothetical protein SHIRM173S_12575 [Streptomyces hirsutus]